MSDSSEDKPKIDKPKIIVDDDWKTQVQAEKEALRQQSESPEQPSDDSPNMQLPPASFTFLLTTLATQAMTALGQAPDPLEGKPVMRPELAKHHIDTIGMLEEKTAGNLSKEEAAMLADLLYQLRMLFVAVKQGGQSQKGE